MTAYELLIESANKEFGDVFRYDLSTKTISYGNVEFIKNGVVPDIIHISDTIYTIDAPIDKNLFRAPYKEIERLYKLYRNSVPTKYSAKTTEFKTASVDDLSFDEMMAADTRADAAARLYGYIIFGSAMGLIPWPDERKFFWQSKRDRDLFVFRNWIK